MPLKISLCPQIMEKNYTKRREICFRAERAPGNSGSQSLVVLQLVLLQAHTAMLSPDFCLQLKPLKCTDTHNTRTQKRVNFVYPRGLIFLIIQLTSRFSGPTFFGGNESCSMHLVWERKNAFIRNPGKRTGSSAMHLLIFNCGSDAPQFFLIAEIALYPRFLTSLYSVGAANNFV